MVYTLTLLGVISNGHDEDLYRQAVQAACYYSWLWFRYRERYFNITEQILSIR